MDKIEQGILEDLLDAAEPFTSDKVVTETSGTIPLMDKLRRCIDAAEEILEG